MSLSHNHYFIMIFGITCHHFYFGLTTSLLNCQRNKHIRKLTLFLLRAIATLVTFPNGTAICTRSASLVSGGTLDTSITLDGAGVWFAFASVLASYFTWGEQNLTVYAKNDIFKCTTCTSITMQKTHWVEKVYHTVDGYSGLTNSTSYRQYVRPDQKYHQVRSYQKPFT